MARVQFQATIERIIGKLAGSVFQDSYGGFQIRTRVSPRNPRTQLSQLRRGEFAFITQGWRELTEQQRQTWIDAAPYPSAAFNLFVSSNINATLANIPFLYSYVQTPAPAPFPIEIAELGGGVFTVRASGPVKIVPAESSLIFYATAEKPVTRLFTNPSEFQPILFFPQLTDLELSTSVAAQWKDHYGQFREDKRICIKSALINNANGTRADSDPTCANEILPETYFIIDDDSTFVTDYDGSFISFP